MKIILYSIFLFLNTPALFAQSGVAFLRFAPDASSASMGGANVSASNNAYATYWNPAGLAAIRETQNGKAIRNEMAFSHHTWVGDIRTYAGAARFNLGEKSALGVSITASGVSNLEARLQPGDPLGLFSASYGNVSVSLGQMIGKNLRIGATAKYLNEQLDTYSANGFAADAGFQALLANGDVQLGASIRNIGQMRELKSEATKLPTTAQGGVTLYPFRIINSNDAALLSTRVSAEMSRNLVDEVSQMHFGVASRVFDILTVRGGYITNDALRSYSVGLGFLFKWQDTKGLYCDYAYIPFKSGFGSAGHLISVHYGW